MCICNVSSLFSKYVDLDYSNVLYEDVVRFPSGDGYIEHHHICFKTYKKESNNAKS